LMNPAANPANTSKGYMNPFTIVTLLYLGRVTLSGPLSLDEIAAAGQDYLS
jgi:hypothetical protein